MCRRRSFAGTEVDANRDERTTRSEVGAIVDTCRKGSTVEGKGENRGEGGSESFSGRIQELGK